MSEDNMNDLMIVESTPVRTIRNLKIRQSLTNIRGDVESEDSQERMSQANQQQQQHDTNLTNGNSTYLVSHNESRRGEQGQGKQHHQNNLNIHTHNKQNMEEYIKRVEQFSNEVKPNFKRKVQQHTSATVIQVKRVQSQEDPLSQQSSYPTGPNNGADETSLCYDIGENIAEDKLKNESESLLKDNAQLSSQLAYGQVLQQKGDASSSQLLPLRDKTNNIQQSQRRSFRRFQTKIGTMNEMYTGQTNLTNREDNAATENIQKMQYVNIDMEYALNFVMSKSKLIKEKIENENISQDFIHHSITQSRAFKIEYNMFLQKLVCHKILSSEFKNVSKKMFEKLEKFFVNRIEKEKETIQMNTIYVRQSQSVQNLLQNRMQILLNDLKNPHKIQLSEISV